MRRTSINPHTEEFLYNEKVALAYGCHFLQRKRRKVYLVEKIWLKTLNRKIYGMTSLILNMIFNFLSQSVNRNLDLHDFPPSNNQHFQI